MDNVCLIVIFAEAFAVVREAAIRKLGMRHFDVQVSVLYLHNHPETHFATILFS
jgi:preprotein translocase subunit SecA